ncbi:MAG: hypothetical protein LQ349_007608 [Xanthoria aureola]|nr:MAG: hypothetical protein LQ349_007608 [Xanthoria aureola]
MARFPQHRVGIGGSSSPQLRLVGHKILTVKPPSEKFSHPLASSIKKTWKWTLSTALGQTPSPQSRSLSHTIPSSQWKFASSIADFLIDADPDPRIRNKARLKPTDLADPKNKGLRDALQKAEYAMMGDYPDVDIA